MRIALGRWLIPGLVIVVNACASSGPKQPPVEVPSGWPVERSKAVVSAGFGAPRGSTRHLGLDLAAPAGTPVRATAGGRVIVAERDGRYGRTVVIDHGGGFRTRYAHLKKIETSAGRRVKRGELVGRVGKSGNASGPHLHYEVLRNGVPVDPRLYLD